jgi:hypothetical protein
MKIGLSAMMSIGAKSARNDGFCDTELAEIWYTDKGNSRMEAFAEE